MGLSLTQRLSLAAAVALCLFLGITGVVLDRAFNASLHLIVKDKLKLHVHNILRHGDVENGVFILPQQLGDAGLDQPNGTLLALVHRLTPAQQQQEQWRSISTNKDVFALPRPKAGQWLFGEARQNKGQSYYVASRTVLWPEADGQYTPFIISVLESKQHYQQQQSDVRLMISVALIVLGLLLLILQLLIFRFGLLPLRQLGADLQQLNRGESDQLSGRYPRELRGLTHNLNLLLENERRQRQHYQERMEDLSHSLKTPLSILTGIAQEVDTHGNVLNRESIIKKVNAQVKRMDNTVQYQLQRAVTPRQNASFIAVNLSNEAFALKAVLDKVYADKDIKCHINIPPKLSVYADENDIAEILGNLMDNAYKYGHHQLAVSGHCSDKENRIKLLIEDDGSGIPAEQHRDILNRGVRLDTAKEGQGLGLAIVVKLINSYQGTLKIALSALGGAAFHIELPGRQGDINEN